MKKYLLLSAIALCIASCSKSDDISNEKGHPQEQGKLTPVTISAKTSVGGNASTRAYWGIPTGNSIAVTFIKGEKFDLFEYGYSGQQVFTCIDATTVQSGNFSGNWQSDGKRWAAILPSGNGSVTMEEDGTNTYTVTLPSTQKTQLRTETNSETNTQYIVSPDPKANVMIASVNDKTTNYACFLAPISSYLYFTTPTSISKVKISATSVTGSGKTGSTIGCMAGKVTVKTGNGTYSEGATNGQWQAWSPFVSSIKSIIPSSETTNEIIVEGAQINSGTVNELNKYVACIYGGNYTKLTFTDVTTGKVIATTKTTSEGKEKVNTFETVYCYNLGQIVAN